MSSIKIESLDLATVSFGALQIAPQTGNKFIPLLRKPAADAVPVSLDVQLPSSLMPFGVGVYAEKKTVSFRADDVDMRAKLEALDEMVLEHIMANPALVGRPNGVSRPALEVRYTALYKTVPAHPIGLLKVKLNFKADGTPAFAHDGVNEGYGDHACRNHYARSIVRIKGVWINNNGFGVLVHMQRLRIEDQVAVHEDAEDEVIPEFED